MNRIIYILAAGALCLAFIAGCGSSKADNGASSELNQELKEKKLINVEVQQVKPSDMDEYLNLTGSVKSMQDIVISSELGGTVRALLVDRGDKVRAGQLLAKISDDIYEAQLSEASANLLLKQAGLKKAQNLHERKSVSDMQLLQARVEHDAAQAQVDIARSRLDRAVINAPFSGVIDDRFVELGELVSPSGPVFRLVDNERLKIVSEFAELDVSSFKAGQKAEVTFDAIPGLTFEAELSFASNTAAKLSRTYPCEFILKNPENSVRGGMIARIRILKQSHHNEIILPQTTLLETEAGRCVFVLEGDKAIRKEVTPGAVNEGMVVIAKGLEPGEMVIIKGHRELVDGQQVRVTAGKD